MLEEYLKNPPEKEKLLAKYKGGNVPPLFAKKDEKDEGLLAEDLLETFRKAFFATYDVPLYISAISKGHPDHEPGSEQVEDLSRQKLSDLLRSCRCLQSFGSVGAGESAEREPHDIEQRRGTSTSGLSPDLCGCCSEEYISAMQDGKARACMCHIGMINLVASVLVAGEIVAVLSMECRKPKTGAIWPRDIFGKNGFRLRTANISSPTAKIDIWEEGKNRIQKCEEVLGLEPGELLRDLTENMSLDPNIEISPEGLETMMIELERTSERLSDLADKNYRLEKGSVVGWLRAEMASALSAPDDFWDKIRWCFGNLAQFVGVDYILLISRDRSRAGSLHLQCQYGLPQDSLPAIQYDWEGSTARVDDFANEVSAEERIQEVDLRQYRDVPVLGMLYSLYGKGVSYPVLVAPATTMDGKLTCMILGNKEPVKNHIVSVKEVDEFVEPFKKKPFSSCSGDFYLSLNRVAKTF